jgi:hypothetical protein
MSERAIERANEALAGLEEELTAGIEGPGRPVTFILGPPRTGTTLVSQLLADRGGFAYVSNFLARFWRAPFIGSRFEQEIGLRDPAWRSSYRSRSGATRGPAEPHEFTYFWNQWFERGQETQKLGPAELAGIDAAALRRAVGSIEAAWELPALFKNGFWFNFQVGILRELFPASVFVRCRRGAVWAAQSIAGSREAIRGSRERWWSMKPAEYPRLQGLPWWEQLAGQVVYTDRELDRALGGLPPESVVEAPYLEVCRDPAGVVGRVADAVRAVGGDLPDPQPLPAGFEPTNRVRLDPAEFRKLEEAVERLETGSEA